MLIYCLLSGFLTIFCGTPGLRGALTCSFKHLIGLKKKSENGGQIKKRLKHQNLCTEEIQTINPGAQAFW